MKRERAAWLFSFLLLAIVALRNPLAAQRDSNYLFVRTLVDIHHHVLRDYVEPVDEKKLEEAAINGLLGQLDPFTAYVPPAHQEAFDRMLEGTFNGVGIQLNQLDNGDIEVMTPIDGSPAAKAGVMAGDIILKVNGDSVQGLRLPDVIKKVKGKDNTEVRLYVKHPTGTEAELKMKRQEIVLPTVKGYQRKTDNSWDYFVSENPKIAYLRITQFTLTTFDDLKSTLTDLLKNGMQGLILDLRWNPGGHLDQAVQVVDLFISKGTIVVTRGRNRPEDKREAQEAGTLPHFPMIVLVNEHSASAAEIVAGSLLDNKRAAVLGTRTYGKGSVQELIQLDGNSGELKMTVAYYYLPSGKLVHRKKGAETWGVEPQIIVPVTEEAEQRVAEEVLAQERFRRPTTQPATKPAPPATQPTDVQLQRAIDTMILMTILQNNPQSATAPAATRQTGH